MGRPRWELSGILVLIPPVTAAQTQRSTPAGSARTVLEQGAADGDPDTRREVAVALSLLARRDAAASPLGKLAADKDHLVREAALVSIGEVHDPALAKPAHDALEDDVPEVAFAAARTLFKLNQPEGKELLLEIAKGEARGKTGFARAKVRDVVRRMKRPKSAALFVAQQGMGFIPVPGLGAGLFGVERDGERPGFLGAGDGAAGVVLGPDAGCSVVRSSRRSTMGLVDAGRCRRDRGIAQRTGVAIRLVPLFEDEPRVRYRAAASFLRLSGPAAAAAAKGER